MLFEPKLLFQIIVWFEVTSGSEVGINSKEMGTCKMGKDSKSKII